MSKESRQLTSDSSGILAWFALNPVAANLLLILVLALGLMQLGLLRKESFPSIEPNIVTVSINYDSGSAKQAEEGLALKVEQALESVPGIKKITSQSNSGGTIVTVVKTSSTELNTLLTDVKKEVDAISRLPGDADNPVITSQRRQAHALMISLYGDTDRRTLQQLQESLKQALLNQSAIHDVIASGSRSPLVSIEFDEAKLQSYGLSFSDVTNVLNNESLNAVAGELRGQNRTLSIKAASQAYRYQDYAQLPLINGEDGNQILLGDVANIRDGFEDSSVMMRFQGQPAVSLQLVMDEYSDITKVVSQAKSLINQWKIKGHIPENVKIDAWYDNSEFIKDRLNLMSNNAFQGIILVALLLAIFLNLRVAFWVAAGLPFCFIGTFFFMGDSFLGLSINELTTFGFIMALGIVVDDAVVIGESIYTIKDREGDTIESTIKGTKRVAVPAIFGVLTTVAVFFPISQVEGMLGKVFAQFSSIVVVCLLLSLIESKLILPAHLAHVKTKHEGATNVFSRFWQSVQNYADNGLNHFNLKIYKPILQVVLAYRYAVLLGFISFVILSYGLVTNGKVRSVFFPEIAGEVVSVSFATEDDAGFGLTKTHIQTLEKALSLADEKIQQQRGLQQSVVQSVLVSIDSDNSGSMKVELSKESKVTLFEMEKAWRELIPPMEAVKKLAFNTGGFGIDDLRFELLGDNAEQLDLAAEKLFSLLEGISGVKNLDSSKSAGQPQIRLRLTPEGRARGFSSSELAKQVLQNFGGERVQRYQRKLDEVEVKIRYPQADRQTIAALQQSRIRSPEGKVIPLTNVAIIELGFEKKSIKRLNKKTALTISASVDKKITSPSEIIAKLQSNGIPEIEQTYHGVVINFGGQAEQQMETVGSMIRMFFVALMMIYMLLAIPLKSYLQPLLIMMVIPFGIVGAIWGHLFSGLSISILSLFGMMALSGVVINDSLLLVSFFNKKKQQGLTTTEALTDACSSRLRAIFLTSITTFAGLIPILSETSNQSEFLKPAAASMAYGILFATLITLVLIPVLLKVTDDFKNWINPTDEVNSKTGDIDETQPVTS